MLMKYNPARRLLLNALGIFFSVIPVTVSIFSYFPLWIAREDASVLSGFTLVLLLLALVPCYKYFKAALQSASAPFLWFIIFIAFMLLSQIANEVTVISFVGFIGNVIGAIFFRIARAESNDRGA